MPRTEVQFAQMRDLSNQKIRSAAIKLFAQKGFAATSIDDIAESAQISKGLVYRHYESKDVLFSSLFEAAIEGTKDMIRLIETDANPRDIMENIASDIYENMAGGEDFPNLMLLMTQGFMSKSLPDYSAAVETDIHIVESGAKLIQRGQKMGVFGQGNPKEMIVHFFSCIQGLVMLKSVLGNAFQMPDTGIITAFLYRGL